MGGTEEERAEGREEGRKGTSHLVMSVYVEEQKHLELMREAPLAKDSRVPPGSTAWAPQLRSRDAGEGARVRPPWGRCAGGAPDEERVCPCRALSLL